MRRKNTKPTVPLDVVLERRTERFPPRFRPLGRFCELRFRYLSSPTGREGEINRPLDHIRQIPFIHSARSCIVPISIYIGQCSSYFFFVVSASVSWYGVFDNCTCALGATKFGTIVSVFWNSIRYMLVRISVKYMEFAHARLLSK